MKQFSYKNNRRSLKKAFAVLCVFLAAILTYAESSLESKDAKLLDGFINAKGYKDYILFTPSNIKQFWTDKSVSSKNENINIILGNTKDNQKESNLFKIQLANVLETQDCKVEIITDSPDVSFTIYNSKNKVLSSSSQEDDFIQYHIVSSTFHLEDTDDFSFYCAFSSKTDLIAIKNIIISFSDNPNSAFLGSPGFDKLLEIIEAEGKNVPDSDVKYYIMENQNKIFIRIPKELPLDTWFAYHVYPIDEKDILPERKKQGDNFNNYNFIPLNKPKTIIPEPCFSDSKYSIIQLTIPSYQYKILIISQWKDNQRFWRLQINK